MGRIQLNDTAPDIVKKMCDGNPGALVVLMKLLSQTFHGVHGAMLIVYLDEWGIYGPDIWILYKDHCHESMQLLERAIRAVQCGCITIDKLKTPDFDAEVDTLPVERMLKGERL